MSEVRHSFDSSAAVLSSVGVDLGVTAWMLVTQDRINKFADATGDHQWIHLDAERSREGPFGATIAHGYLTLSLASHFLPQLVGYRDLKLGINYGCEKVRFPSPVRVGSRIRGHGKVIQAQAVAMDGVQVTVRITVEIEGSDKPGCVVDTLSRLHF